MSEPVRVQLSRRKGWRMPLNTVKVARPSKWGNPFVVCPDEVPGELLDDDKGYVAVKDAVAAVQTYRGWLTESADTPELLRDVQTLRGKNLACWCPLDQPCHADVLLEIANSAPRATHEQER